MPRGQRASARPRVPLHQRRGEQRGLLLRASHPGLFLSSSPRLVSVFTVQPGFFAVCSEIGETSEVRMPIFSWWCRVSVVQGVCGAGCLWRRVSVAQGLVGEQWGLVVFVFLFSSVCLSVCLCLSLSSGLSLSSCRQVHCSLLDGRNLRKPRWRQGVNVVVLSLRS